MKETKFKARDDKKLRQVLCQKKKAMSGQILVKRENTRASTPNGK